MLVKLWDGFDMLMGVGYLKKNYMNELVNLIANVVILYILQTSCQGGKGRARRGRWRGREREREGMGEQGETGRGKAS